MTRPVRRASTLTVLLGLALGGCTIVPEATSLPPSPMSAAYTEFRRSLDVEARAIDRPPYRAVSGCTYRTLATDLGGRDSDRPVELSVRPVRERLLVSVAAGPRTSTALIDSEGRMFDFSLAGASGTVNPETWKAAATKQAEALRRAGDEGAHVFNELSLIVPHYLSARFNPGSTVAILADEDGGTWAAHVYRGVTDFAGRQALLFDLLGAGAPSASPDQLVGFALVDPATMLPLALIVDGREKRRFEQIGCR